MSPRAAARTQVNYTVDNEPLSEEEWENIPDQGKPAAQNKPSTASPPATKKRGRKAATTTTKPRAKVRRTSASLDAKQPAMSKPAAARTEIPSTQAAYDDESEDELGSPNVRRATGTPLSASKAQSRVVAPAQPPRKAASEEVVKPRNKGGRPRKKAPETIPETQMEDMDVDGEQQATSNLSKGPKTKAPKPVKKEVVQETQVEGMDVDEEEEKVDSLSTEPVEQAPPARKPRGKVGGKQKPQTSGRRKAETPAAEEPPTATTPRSKAERVSVEVQAAADAAVERRLSDLTRKLENMESRYQTLKDVGVSHAQSNFDELRRKADERTKASEALISSLRSELATQSARAAETEGLQDKVTKLMAENAQLKNERVSLDTAMTNVNSELRAIKAKLQAARSGSEQRTVPGSTVKTNGVQRNNAAATEDLQKRQMKEDLYGDLTGLIIRDVKRRDEDNMDVYDCIQAGRNGTLHFHLAVPNPPPAGTNYGDAGFEYSPLLDTSHDRNMIDVLPDYLTEEIEFPQSEAPRFYSRINEALMRSRKPQVDAGQIEDDDLADEGADADAGMNETA